MSGGIEGNASWSRLFAPGASTFCVAALGAPAYDDLLAELAVEHPPGVVARMSGAAARTQKGFFDEIRRALHIPYDSVGWNVLNEAVADLTWLPGDSYLLAVSEAQLLLRDADPGALEILGEILGRPPHRRGTGSREPAPRRVLLQAEPADVGDLMDRLGGAGIHFDRLE